MSTPSLGIGSVRAAATALSGRVLRTPVVSSPAINRRAGAAVYFKCENLQHIGAFKARGALLNALHLSEAQRSKGLITYSSGNHGQAVAFAATQLGTACTVFAPETAPAIKVEGMRRLGADVRFAGTTSDHRKAAAGEHAARSGGSIIEPFDSELTIAGQGTATLELLEEVPDLHAVFIPVGGGGLVAGACLATEETEIELHTVEPKGCDSMARSLAAGERISVEPGPSLADGLRPTTIGELNFSVAKGRITQAHTTADPQILSAMKLLLTEAKLVVEPSAAAALAPLLSGALRTKPWATPRVGVILSGGNVAPELIAQALQ